MHQLSSETLRIHPLIFPAFEKQEKQSKDFIKNTTAYAEIALKIFKELGPQDLRRTQLVCKEWKQLIESSFLAKEKAYTLALKHAIRKKNLIQEAFYLEKLGDVYVEKGTSEAFLQAAGLYNYALQRLFLSHPLESKQKVLKEKLSKVQDLLVRECKGRSVDLATIKDQFESNRKILKEFRKGIEAKIQALSETPSSQEVMELYREIAQRIKIFFKQIVAQSLDTLGPPPCEYSMIGFGSLAREEMTPYSDLEFGILIQEDNPINRDYFRRLTTLLHLKVINLGETILPALNIPCLKAINFFDDITPRGFAFDGAGVEGKGCKTPLGNGKTFELIQTPEKMAQYIGKDNENQWWHEREPHLPLELLNFAHLQGSRELTQQYKENVQKKLNAPCQKDLTLRQYLAKFHLFLADMNTFDPGMGDLSREGMLFKVKDDFYRFPHLALDRLALLKAVTASDTFSRIKQLNKLGVITESATEKLNEWMSIALFMRLKTYSHYQAQREMMNPLIRPFKFDEPTLIQKQFALDHKALENIKKIYHTFIPFRQAIQEFFSGHEERLTSSSLDDDSPQIQGDIARRIFQQEEAKKCYLKAIQENSENTYALTALGLIYENQGNLEKAAKYAHASLAIAIKHDGNNCPEAATVYNNLLMIYYAQGNLAKAAEYGNQALQININLYGKNHSYVANSYNSLGLVYQEQGNLEKASESLNQALAIDHKLFGENHSMVAKDYNNLGMLYKDKGNLKKATEFIRHALLINFKLYGNNHPHVATCYNNLSLIYEDQGNLKKARKYADKTLTIRLNLYGKNHPLVAITYNNLGLICENQGNLKKAFNYIREALQINLKLLGENNPTVAGLYNHIGQIYKKQGNLKKAIQLINKALATNIKLGGENQPSVAIDYQTLGSVYLDKGNLGQAEEYINKALAINLNLFGENHPFLTASYNNLGLLYQKQGNLENALKYANKALAINIKLYGKNHPKVAIAHNNLGEIYEEQGNLEKAFEYINEALDIKLKLFGENHPTVAINYNNLGGIYLARGNLEKAVECANQALVIDLKFFGKDHPTVACNYNNLGVLYEKQGLSVKAIEYINQAIDIDLKLFGENHPTLAIYYTNLGRIYQAQENLDIALKYAHLALDINLKVYGKNHPQTVESYKNLESIYQEQKKISVQDKK
ncbi:tetratricopeptide repeat protein [Neochlamydia sp. EPS4]|uniref:tetratricopeptide repeat protein n=1 Tax=Neochlamydia sp. EPS4 TaxID=1478175 RepID=UPI0005D0F8FC|nr:tetratricopeptide repeat protein [Neochlamydia sp. EPS4]